MGFVWTPAHAKVHQTLRSRQLLPRGQRLLLAVSGGQDSLCLLRLLVDLQPKWGWELWVGHCDHGWRLDSAANAQHVVALAAQWGVAAIVRTATVALPSEAAARQWRYEQMRAIAADRGCEAVVTGHTASDRAETLLYNLARGSGADGLSTLVWRRQLEPESQRTESQGPGIQGPGIQLVRPLLNWTRAETGAFCQAQQLPVWEDETNADCRYRRNRIRHEVMPLLQQALNPQVEQHLAQTAELLQAEVAYLEAQATAVRQTVVTAAGLNRRQLQPVPLALQRRVIRQWLQAELQGQLPELPNFEQVQKVLALLSAPNRSQSDPLPGGAIAVVAGDWIQLQCLDKRSIVEWE